MDAAANERELCAKIAEGRAVWHRDKGRGREAKEADAIADAIRDRSVYPDPKRPALARA
jgi:hypothetical protein